MKSAFAKSMLMLIGGSAAAQVITIVVSPLTTRLFSAEELGIYTLITSAPSMFGAILSLRYDMAIVYDENKENILPLVLLSLIIVLFSSAIIATGYYFYYSLISSIPYDSIGAAIFTFFQCVLFGIINVLNSWNNRLKEYKVMSSANVERSVVQNIGIVGMGLMKLGINGLLLAQTLGYLAGMIRQGKTLHYYASEIKAITSSDIKRVALKHKSQAIWSTPASFANGFSYTAINYMIEYLYNATVVGYYSMSFRMLGMPINIVSGNISRVFAEKAANDKFEQGNFRHIFVKTLIAMSLCAVPITIIAVLFAPLLFSVVFGQGWDIAGKYVQILAPMFSLRFIAGALSASTMISGRQRLDFLIQLMLIVALISSFICSIALSLDIEVFLFGVSVSFSVIYVVYIGIFWRCANI